MSEQPELTLWSSRPVARRTDPDTSWAAAESLDELRLTRSRRLILELLRAFGPMTDEAIWACIIRGDLEHSLSPSGARTRRAELVSMGLVTDTTERIIGRTGRRMILWGAR